MTSSDHLRGVTEVDSDGGGDFEDFLEGRYFQDRFLEFWYAFVGVTSSSVLGPSVEPPRSTQVLSSDSSAAYCACLHKQASSLQIRVLGLILVGSDLLLFWQSGFSSQHWPRARDGKHQLLTGFLHVFVKALS